MIQKLLILCHQHMHVGSELFITSLQLLVLHFEFSNNCFKLVHSLLLSISGTLRSSSVLQLPSYHPFLRSKIFQLFSFLRATFFIFRRLILLDGVEDFLGINIDKIEYVRLQKLVIQHGDKFPFGTYSKLTTFDPFLCKKFYQMLH